MRNGWLLVPRVLENGPAATTFPTRPLASSHLKDGHTLGDLRRIHLANWYCAERQLHPLVQGHNARHVLHPSLHAGQLCCWQGTFAV